MIYLSKIIIEWILEYPFTAFAIDLLIGVIAIIGLMFILMSNPLEKLRRLYERKD